MDIIIRKANIDDAKPLLEYLKRIGSESDNLTFGAEGLPYTVEQEKEELKDNETNTNTVFFVAEENGKIVGDASFISSGKERICHHGELGITVLKSHWGKGVGSKLMDAVIDFAKNTAKAEYVYLNVRSDNIRAIKLYERFGFVKTGVIPGFMKVNGSNFDCDYMCLKL